MRIFHFLLAAWLLLSATASAQRQDILLDNQWDFRFSHQVEGKTIRVDLPHTWNAQDALSGKLDYKRGIGNYERRVFIRPECALRGRATWPMFLSTIVTWVSI